MKINGESVVSIVLGRRAKNQFVWRVKVLPHVRPRKRPINQLDSREKCLLIGDAQVENGADAPTNQQDPAVQCKVGSLIELHFTKIPLGRFWLPSAAVQAFEATHTLHR